MFIFDPKKFEDEYQKYLIWKKAQAIYDLDGHVLKGTMRPDPNDVALFGKPCCGGVNSKSPTFSNGKWHDPNCDTLKAPANIPNYGEQLESDFEKTYAPEYNGKKCTCGSASLGSDRHSDWCDIK